MKNRIWKRTLAVGVCLIAGIRFLAGCMAQPEMVCGAEIGIGTVVQEAVWTDQDKSQALVSVHAEGLSGFSDHRFESASAPDECELVIWLSEYFLPDTSFIAPQGCLREELPIITADGRSSSITGFRWKIKAGEDGKRLDIPVVLREEYRFPVIKTAVPTCQTKLPANGVIGAEERGGVYIVKNSGTKKEIICQAETKNLVVPAAVIDFSMEMNSREDDIFAGKRILMDVSLTNSGQVPLYNLSLQTQAKGMEVIPVWEKEPGLEISENGAILNSLTQGEKRTISFYMDTMASQIGPLVLEVMAKTENPVSLEKTIEQQLTVQPLKASFTVKKTADCENASPGDVVTYQISIHNTGEQTLHSVITTERFGLAGVTAAFLSQEGVILNKSKTQAKIPEIVPGGCVNLKARVVIPENLEDQELVNQIIVVTDETGEESAIRDQATIRVETKNDKKGNGSKGEDHAGNRTTVSPSPKTGDHSYKEVFQALILLSLIFSIASARRMFFNRKD